MSNRNKNVENCRVFALIVKFISFKSDVWLLTLNLFTDILLMNFKFENRNKIFKSLSQFENSINSVRFFKNIPQTFSLRTRISIVC